LLANDLPIPLDPPVMSACILIPVALLYFLFIAGIQSN
jgi:hypothetical protein